jgi:hypothetical protein
MIPNLTETWTSLPKFDTHLGSIASACGIRFIFFRREPELTGDIVLFLQVHSSSGCIVECGQITAAANGERVHLIAW